MDYRETAGSLLNAGCGGPLDLQPGSVTPATAITDRGYSYENRSRARIESR